MADVPDLPNDMWSKIYYELRRSAATTLQAIRRALGPRRILREHNRQRERRALLTIRNYLTYVAGSEPGLFGRQIRRIGYRRVNFSTLRDRIALRLTQGASAFVWVTRHELF